MMKAWKKIMFVFALLSTMTLGAWAQVGLGNIPKTVKASDAWQMDEMGAWMAEKGGRSAEKRVQIVVFEGVIVMQKTGY